MTKTTTVKTLSIATAFAIAAPFTTTAMAHDVTNAGQGVSAIEKQRSVSKSNARNLVNELLKREYSGEQLSARKAVKEGNKWKVSIKRGIKHTATAYVNDRTDDIHIENDKK